VLKRILAHKKVTKNETENDITRCFMVCILHLLLSEGLHKGG
jgi:hypothetical protein